MKSKFFKTRSISMNEKNTKSLQTVSKLPANILDEIAKWINEDYQIESRRLEARYSSIEIEKVNDLCAKCEIQQEDFINIFDFVTYIIRTIYELDDNISDVVDDFVSQKLIGDETKDKVLNFLKTVEGRCIVIAKQYRKDNYEIKSLPVLDKVDYAVHLRLIPNTPFEPFDVPIEEYQPKAADLALLATIELTVADGSNKNVTNFQLNFIELEDLIVRLQACQKDMRLLQSYQEKYDVTKI